MNATTLWSDTAIETLNRNILGLIQRPKVLVVDDDVNDITLFNSVLQNFKCELVCCETEAQATALLKQGNFDLCFVDLKLKIGEGIGVIKNAKQEGVKTCFIAVTGYPEAADAFTAIQLGAVSVIVKPPTVAQMRAIFGELTT